MCSCRNLVFSYSLLVSMLSHSSVFTSPLGRSPPFWVSFPDMVAAVTIACDVTRHTVTVKLIFDAPTLNVASVASFIRDFVV